MEVFILFDDNKYPVRQETDARISKIRTSALGEGHE
jgi:hypothetical protein